MLKRVVEFGSYFDWITPLVAFFKDWMNRPAHTFLIPDDCGWSALEIERVLRRHGIKTWGVMIVKGSIMMTMRLAQAHWAQYLLEREGIPIEYGLLEERSMPADRGMVHDRRSTPAPAPPRTGLWAEVSRTLHDVVDEISKLF
jgi:hypothetical protein